MPQPLSHPADLPAPEEPRHRNARQIFLRGLAITLPSILTLVIVLWLGRVVYDYIIYPVSTLVRYAAAQAVDQSVPTSSLSRWEALPPLELVERRYRVTPALKADLVEQRDTLIAAGKLDAQAAVPATLVFKRAEAANGSQIYVTLGKRAVPYADYFQVVQELPDRHPATATDVYMELVTIRYFGSTFTLSSLAVLLAILAIYFVGRLVTIRLGAWLVGKVETDVLGRLPIVSKVYGSVKQVTDFVFSERQVSYNRVVALEYPRRGIWSIGFVTGEGMRQTADAAGEPLVNVLIPTSPAPVTGYTMSVPRSQVIDLDITIDQAFQFIISCGVLVPTGQQATVESTAALRRETERRQHALQD